jgi:hypothetical protein
VSASDYISTSGGLNWGVYASVRATCSLDYANATISCSAPYPQFVLGFDNAAAPSMVVAPEKLPTTGAWFNVTVAAGWNLISVPISGPTTMPGALQDKVNGGAGLVGWSRAMWYNPATPADPWKQYYTGWNSALNDLANVDRTMGVWLFVTSVGDGAIALGGTSYSTPSTTAISLKTGWNLIGFPSNDVGYTVAMMKASCPSVTIVERYNVTMPYLSGAMSNAEALAAGKGYWAYVVADSIWTVTW